MNSIPSTLSHPVSHRIFRRAISILILTLLLSIPVFAQYNTTTSVTDAGTPSGIAPGAPIGSYALGGFDTVNLFNGHLNFSLPLLNVSGRGQAGYTINLPIEQTWRVKNNKSYAQGPGGFPTTPASYQYYPEYNSWAGIKPGYSPGVLQGRRARDRSPDPVQQPFPTGYSCNTLTRLTFTASNGTEYELRDAATDGAPHGSYNNETFSRGTTFVSRDSTALTFISDTAITDMSCNDTSYAAMNGMNLIYPSGYLLFPNGTRYRLDGGKVTWIRDHNGNKLTFTSTSVTDSLNRTVTFSGGVIFNGFGGVQRTISVSYSSLSQALRGDVSGVKTYYQLFPLNGSSNSTTFNPSVVSSVTLPNGRSYNFKYNEYGELARVELPTGGAYEYDYGAGSASGYHSSGIISANGGYAIYRRVLRKRIYRNGAPGATPESTVEIKVVSGGATEEAQYAGSDTTATPLARAKHYFYGSPLTSFTSSDWYANWDEGKEYQTEELDPASGNPLRVVTHVWKNHTSPRPYDPYIEQTTTKLADTNQVTKQTFAYDQYNNRTDVYEYDYGVSAPPTFPTRHTHTDYLTTNVVDGVSYNYPADTSIYLRNLARETKIYAVNTQTGAETLFSDTIIDYDQSALTDAPGIVGLDAAFNSAYKRRGNITRTSRWLNTNGTWLNADIQYDVAGNVLKSTDARGYITQLEYSAAYAYAYPTRTISPIPGGYYSSSTPLETTSAYDFSTGLRTSKTDSNNQITSFEYNDLLDRLTRVVRPAGGGWTTYEYYVNAYGDCIHTQTLQNSSGLVADSYQFFDGLSRPYRSFQYEGIDPVNVYLTSDTQYDAMGRVWRVSNTYRSANAAALINPSGIWTTSTYDTLGRLTAVTTSDNATVTTSYSGNQVTVTDQAGKRRSSQSDALGRLTQVIEDPGGPLACQTDYLYDALGNLRKVTQGTQSRFFMYDSLSRLIRAKNPEQNINGSLALTDTVSGNSQWAMAYAYDNNGNLASRTDARGVTSSFTYDGLNRNTLVTYSDGSSTTHYFDGATNGRGRLWVAHHYPANGAYTQTAIDNYDALGQPLSQRVNFWTGAAWSANYTVNRTYDLSGHVSTQTYPSGRTVSYTYDRMGRTASLTGNLGDSVSRTYMTAMSFDDSGRMTRERFGTDIPLYNKRRWNRRNQLFDIRLSTVNDEDNWNRGTIVNYYSLSNWCFGYNCTGTDTNGNLQIQQYYIPNDDAMSSSSLMQQNYGYDALNRVNWMGEYMNGSGATPSGAQGYDYDRWGNRTINPGTWGTGINNKQLTVDPATNRLGVPAGQAGVMQYDANGNLINDTYTSYGSRTFDAENRMLTAWDISGQQSQYTYDSEGRRVRRKVGVQAEVWQIYGMDGELVAEYTANSAVTTPQKEYGYRNGEMLVAAQSGANVQWIVTDQRGTPRMIADRTGTLGGVKRRDYLPFGEELFAGSGNRTAAQGYVASGVRQKFTTYERDDETGLDYAQARYFASTQGRFISVDPSLESASPTHPQSWNRYAYVINNPLTLVDPTGENWFFVTRDNHHYWEWHSGDEVRQTQNGEEWTDPATGTTYVSQYTNLVVIEYQGVQQNANRAYKATITIYGRGWTDRVAYSDGSCEEDAFIGQGRPIAIGEYFINLNRVGEAKDAKSSYKGQVGPGGLWAFYGFQFIPPLLDGRPVQDAWGTKRAYLSRALWDKNGLPYYGDDMNSPWYLHGHMRSFDRERPVDNTDGCVGTKFERALGWMAQVARGTISAHKIVPVTVHQKSR